MAEQEPKPVEVVEVVQSGDPVLIEVPEPLVILVNRPRKVYSGMWGPVEISAVAVSTLAVLASLVVYFFFVIPSNRELASNKSEADRLDAEQMSAKSKYGEITSSETQVSKLLSSVDDFQTRFLPVSSTGQAALYQRLNGLIGAYGLVNTTGPDYASLETVDLNSGQQTNEERGRSKYRSLFPGVYVTVTVEGSYQNLRRFIREIETGREFIVVSSVELAPSDSEGQKAQPNPGLPPKANQNPAFSSGQTVINPTTGQPMAKPFSGGINPPIASTTAQQATAKQRGKMHGETVSLHIELAAYFRRPGFVPMAVTPAQQ